MLIKQVCKARWPEHYYLLVALAVFAACSAGLFATGQSTVEQRVRIINHAVHYTGSPDAFERCVRQRGDSWMICAYEWRAQ
jgi:hypothetical protein